MDIDLAASFLCTRSSYITEEDWENLRRLLHYLQPTLDLSRIIGANGLDILKTWVDASYTTHYETRGHTGGVMYMGQDIIHGKSSTQKINSFFH